MSVLLVCVNIWFIVLVFRVLGGRQVACIVWYCRENCVNTACEWTEWISVFVSSSPVAYLCCFLSVWTHTFCLIITTNIRPVWRQQLQLLSCAMETDLLELRFTCTNDLHSLSVEHLEHIVWIIINDQSTCCIVVVFVTVAYLQQLIQYDTVMAV